MSEASSIPNGIPTDEEVIQFMMELTDSTREQVNAAIRKLGAEALDQARRALILVRHDPVIASGVKNMASAVQSAEDERLKIEGEQN